MTTPSDVRLAAAILRAGRALLAATAAGRSAEGYNPYRRPDGSFAPGPEKKRKRKRKARKRTSHKEVGDRVTGQAKAAGLRATYSSGPARTRREWKEARDNREAGQHTFAVSVKGRVEVSKNGAMTLYKGPLATDAGLEHKALYSVSPKGDKKGRWDADDHTSASGGTRTFKTEAEAHAYAGKKAEAHARDYAEPQAYSTATPSADGWFRKEGGSIRSDVMFDRPLPTAAHAKHFEVDVRHIRPGGPAPGSGGGAKPRFDIDDDTPMPELRSGHRKRVPEATSAESILRLVLRKRGWAAAYRRGDLTDAQRVGLLSDVREYARARLRAEAESFARDHLGHEGRAIGDAVAGQFRRFFGRVRGFVREAIVAGALAFSGPGGLDADDLEAAEAAARVQDGYLARFEEEVVGTPPMAIDPAKTTTQQAGPDGAATEIMVASPGMTPGEFVARAESYGSSVYASAQNVARSKVGRSGSFDEERRVHLGHDEACPVCDEATARGWQPIGSLPEIGDSYCRGNCHCFFEYRKGPGGAS